MDSRIITATTTTNFEWKLRQSNFIILQIQIVKLSDTFYIPTLSAFTFQYDLKLKLLMHLYTHEHTYKLPR